MKNILDAILIKEVVAPILIIIFSGLSIMLKFQSSGLSKIKEGNMKLTSEKAFEMLNDAKGKTITDLWITHSICVANTASIIAKEEWFKETGAHNRDCEDALDMVMSIAIVRIAFFVRVVNGTSRVSLRSKGKIDVSAIAGKFGGGGHFNAAGCTLDMLDVEKAKDLVLKEILEVYK